MYIEIKEQGGHVKCIIEAILANTRYVGSVSLWRFYQSKRRVKIREFFVIGERMFNDCF